MNLDLEIAAYFYPFISIRSPTITSPSYLFHFFYVFPITRDTFRLSFVSVT